ncbi:hypothetical protein [Pyrococcus sp. ST04]|uniref:hypothetical protein n=1 Tax=Pyrococcus sp. ST04 TaxID=1183377 RepID=UPI0002605963|nr:hypothetical protein [Pyrococcus sp. ST04]AFK21780.1 hypothetical protein Py04_0175 [Pyrococcus sp. ST04]
MRGLPLIIPIMLVSFVTIGLARVKTIGVVVLFSLLYIYGYSRGTRIGGNLGSISMGDDVRLGYLGLFIAGVIILVQILKIGSVPLLNPSIRSMLNPKLTMLTYLLGVPSSVYLLLNGRKLGLLYPVIISLYAYRTPVLVSVIAISLVYLQKLEKRNVVLVLTLGVIAFLALSFVRTGLNFLVRVQGTTSVLDVIVKRCSLLGFYKGKLQMAGITSYLWGGFGPRMMISRYLGVHDVTTTATLIGGMYLDFGMLAGLEMLLLGFYYGLLENVHSNLGRTLYYSTLAYGIVGVETGLLDLPVYVLFLLGILVFWREKNVSVRKIIPWI